MASSRTTRPEIVVIANGTPDDQLHSLEQREDIVVVHSRFNLGFGGGNNLAAAIAKGRYLIFVNEDSTLDDGCIDRLVETAERDPSIGAVGSRILMVDGTVQEAGSILWADGRATQVGRGTKPNIPAPPYFYVREVDCASANGLLVRRDAWDHVGGFDQQFYPAYYEDTDLSMSLRSRGYRVMFEPRASITDHRHQNGSRPYREFLMCRNRNRFVAKWPERLAELEPRPGWPDIATIERAINRAMGMPPRVLVDIESDATSGVAKMWDVAASLARRGWAVVASASPSACTALHDHEPRTWERLVDLGVDIRAEGVPDILASVRDFEVVVIEDGLERSMDQLPRMDGGFVPVVGNGPSGGGDLRELLDSVGRSARRRPSQPGLS